MRGGKENCQSVRQLFMLVKLWVRFYSRDLSSAARLCRSWHCARGRPSTRSITSHPRLTCEAGCSKFPAARRPWSVSSRPSALACDRKTQLMLHQVLGRGIATTKVTAVDTVGGFHRCRSGESSRSNATPRLNLVAIGRGTSALAISHNE